MKKQTIKTCSDSHEEVIYQSDQCPCCKLKGELADLLNDKEDMDEQNIESLYKQLKLLDKRCTRLENTLPQPKRSLFRKHSLVQ